MKPEDFKKRTKAYALRIIAFYQPLPRNPTCVVLGRQLLRSGTSVGANYRSACRAKSRLDFISRVGTAEEEADETPYWLGLLVESGEVRQQSVQHLSAEGDEILALVVASINTARRRS